MKRRARGGAKSSASPRSGKASTKGRGPTTPSTGAPRLRAGLARDQLHAAEVADVLLHGLAEGDPDAVFGVIEGARGDVATIAALTGAIGDGLGEVDACELANTLRAIVRRLDVGLELMRRTGGGRVR